MSIKQDVVLFPLAKRAQTRERRALSPAHAQGEIVQYAIHPIRSGRGGHAGLFGQLPGKRFFLHAQAQDKRWTGLQRAGQNPDGIVKLLLLG